MSVRLAFAGASGTGKSTLARAVAEKLGLPICPIGSREVSKAMGFESPYDVDKAGQRRNFQKRLIAEKSTWENGCRGGFVTDRTHFDNLAYTEMHDHELASEPEFRATVFSAMRNYTHVVLCTIETFHNVGTDPARNDDPVYHRQFQRHLLTLFGVDAFRLFDGSRRPLLLLGTTQEERVAQVMEYVGTGRGA